MPTLETSNITAATKRQFLLKALKSRQAYEADHAQAKSSLGAHRAVLKDAKKAGVSVEAIARVLAERDLDPDVVEQQEADYIEMKAISGQPFKFQPDLLGGKTLEFSAQDTEEMRDARAYDEGLKASRAGHSGTLNPHHQGTSEQDCWHRGWLQGQKEAVDRLAPKEKKPRTPRKGKQTGEAPAAEAEPTPEVAADEVF